VRRSRVALGTVLAILVAAVPGGAELGFLGPRGSFSDEAAETYRRSAPEAGEAVPYESMTAVVSALREGRISRGILPIASTVAGFPDESQRLLLSASDPGFRVVDEVVVPVDLHLLAKRGVSRERIQRILSHPNALGEAGRFLRERYARVPLEETASTAAAAERVRAGDGSVAAVASAAAARLYDLEILDRSIQEDPRNATSFWVIARPEDAPKPAAARRLVLSLSAAAGTESLSATIASLHETGLDVVFVSSAPLPGEIFGFRYLISLASEGVVARDSVSKALASASPGAPAVVLGWF
jgi:prephenate dehydratase